MDDERRDGGTNSTLRTKEQGTHLTLNEHDDDDDDETYELHGMNNIKMGPDPLLTSSYFWRAASVKMIFRGQATLYFNIMQSSRSGEENEK